MFLPQEIIRGKRGGKKLSFEEIRWFVEGISNNSISEGQIRSFTMAVFLNGMDMEETTELTLAMRDSGRVVDWQREGIDPALVIDKHSTGGVGDEKVTLLVVAIAAACGLYVPNLSGRALGYNGGEVDLLDSIPGYTTSPDLDTSIACVKKTGGSIIGPTPDLAIADAKIYYVRDVGSTIENHALITGSILSKKFCISPRELAISVGCGSGGFMATREVADPMAEIMVEVGRRSGIEIVCPVTNMDSVFGEVVGNALEILEVVDFLKVKRVHPRVRELVLDLVSEMLVMGGLAKDLADGVKVAESRLQDGAAAEKFGQIVREMGGPGDFMTRPGAHLRNAHVVQDVMPERNGYLAQMKTRQIGLCMARLGGGRTNPDDVIDHSVGMTNFAQIGDEIGPNRPICTLHARDEDSWNRVASELRNAVSVVDEPTVPGPVIYKRFAA